MTRSEKRKLAAQALGVDPAGKPLHELRAMLDADEDANKRFDELVKAARSGNASASTPTPAPTSKSAPRRPSKRKTDEPVQTVSEEQMQAAVAAVAAITGQAMEVSRPDESEEREAAEQAA